MKSRRTPNCPTPDEMLLKRLHNQSDFWRLKAVEYLKRALKAEVELTRYEGSV